MAKKSSMIASLVKENPHKDLFDELRDIPSDRNTFELVARFCHGYEIKLSPENVIPLCCVADYLGMTETYSPNNLLMKSMTYFEQRILPNWNESVIALRSAESVLHQATELGLIDDCFKSLISKALEYPQFLDQQRKFSKSEDLTSLPLQLYKPLINEMIENHVPGIYIASSLYQYAKNSPQKQVMEAIEKLLPHETGLLPCTLLFEMLKVSISTEANMDCRNGFETRIGKQLEEATVRDLLIPSSGYSKEGDYDTDCVRRILKIFYNNIAAASDGSNGSELNSVAELIEDFLSEIASDVNLRLDTFISLAEMGSSVSNGMERSSDELYRAIDIYLDKHSYLTELEREEICQVLDCRRLSPEIVQHAAQNSRLPLRIVMQVLFIGQMHLREVITKEVDDHLDDEEEETPLITDDQASRLRSSSTICSSSSSCSKEEVMMEMEKMGKKMRELEKEYFTMKKEIENSKKEKVSLWKEMKKKLGCNGSINDVDCHVKKMKMKKKIHPKN
ncbi:BTB/POZ domain-containing protein At5g17580 [Impatiens glandulifera]|uniref:BTB/POZ domain-containing protein At5g17580 n=1 Tax=Impatiens glandulifera TaxID=253017 RepID=UPI001FB068D8|nr:BTB/POZ domain-containing protein At5g17580 [Impatiens glandulifera]